MIRLRCFVWPNVLQDIGHVDSGRPARPNLCIQSVRTFSVDFGMPAANGILDRDFCADFRRLQLQTDYLRLLLIPG